MTMWQRRLGLDLEVPDDFGHWLAGFVDGEGCFLILVKTGDRCIWCQLQIHLRDDDKNILHQIKEITGVGNIDKRSNQRRRDEGILEWNAITWRVQRIGDIIHVIIPLFEKYPLRAKKRRDFVLWARAARIIQAKGHLTKEGREEVLRLKQEMEEGRKYNGNDAKAGGI